MHDAGPRLAALGEVGICPLPDGLTSVEPLPSAARARYLSQDRLAGHRDLGAEGVARLVEALAWA